MDTKISHIDMEPVGSKYMGLVPYPSGCGECFAVREVIGTDKNGYYIFSPEGPDVEELYLRGSGFDNSASWSPFHNNSILLRTIDKQLFWNTSKGLIPFCVGTFYPNGLLLNKWIELDTIDTIIACKKKHEELFTQYTKSS
jgi:hypothetical protein